MAQEVSALMQKVLRVNPWQGPRAHSEQIKASPIQEGTVQHKVTGQTPRTSVGTGEMAQ